MPTPRDLTKTMISRAYFALGKTKLFTEQKLSLSWGTVSLMCTATMLNKCNPKKDKHAHAMRRKVPTSSPSTEKHHGNPSNATPRIVFDRTEIEAATDDPLVGPPTQSGSLEIISLIYVEFATLVQYLSVSASSFLLTK